MPKPGVNFSLTRSGSMRWGIQFVGLPELEGALAKHPEEAVRKLQEVVSGRAHQTRVQYIEGMATEYTSEFSTHRVADSIIFRTLRRESGVELRFYIRPFRELKFITSIFPGSYFHEFPVGPYPIYPRNKTRLAIRRDVGPARITLAFMRRGQPVLWGSKTGGFSRDVLKDVSQASAETFLNDVYTTMAAELQQLQTNARR